MSNASFRMAANLISATASSSFASPSKFFFKNFFSDLSILPSIMLVAATTASVVLENGLNALSFTDLFAAKGFGAAHLAHTLAGAVVYVGFNIVILAGILRVFAAMQPA